MIFIVIAFLIFTAAREYFFYIERQKLLDRLQAKDYNEFKRYEVNKVNKKEEDNKEERGAYNWL